jgi:ornithine cyclodeaminase/alanine dehydrogenase-like protein (mu-crystallin family)
MPWNSSTLYLSRSTIEAINVPMRRIIEVVEEALIEKAHGRVQMPSKHWIERDAGRWFGGMSCLVPKMGYAVMKWQSGSRENAGHGVPYITGMLFLNDIEDGLVAAVMDATWITQQRTAAASAVAIKYLARRPSRSFAMLGAGVQARSHLEAFRHVLPDLDEVFIYDIDPTAAENFSAVVAQAGYRPRIVASARQAMDATDIIVSGGPIEPNAVRSIESGWLRPGLTAVAIDYDCYWKPAALGAVDRILTDDLGQIEHIKSHRYFVGCPPPDGELGDVVAGLKPGREHPDQKIVILNMGVAVEDLATAREIYQIARSKKVGIELPR